MKSRGVTIQMKPLQQYFTVVLFIMLFKVVLTFESVDEILWCDHLNETSLAVLLIGTIRFYVFYKIKCRIFPKFSFWPLLGMKGLA